MPKEGWGFDPRGRCSEVRPSSAAGTRRANTATGWCSVWTWRKTDTRRETNLNWSEGLLYIFQLLLFSSFEMEIYFLQTLKKLKINFYCHKNFVTCSKFWAVALFLSTALKRNVVHVRHTFVCRAVDTFCVEQMTFLKKVLSRRNSSRCILSSWHWLLKSKVFKPQEKRERKIGKTGGMGGRRISRKKERKKERRKKNPEQLPGRD